ncbi:glycosyltransferase family 2 protein [Pseudogemmobacter bohemicus]|uniref:glycosyltransferase family 2 protein n=1 Tax=Pseudogemmobacter bohemicus TaxID=2250708 RepID=UPI001300AEAA|nr:glycosyltransferase family 2 protein [Pseudogemmobacter bohemicus]
MRRRASWALVATVKAPGEKILAFLAWHLDLGAAEITLCFDEPADPALAAIAARGLPGVRLIACDEAHWQALGGRPGRHQNRQAKNARMVYRKGGADWLGHIDVDEFIWPVRPVSEVLGCLPARDILCRMAPFEAMHDPDLPDDIYTARIFRGALKQPHAALRVPVLGEYAEILPEAMLSHSAGKVFFRSGVPGLSPRLHGAFIGGERLPGPEFHPGLRLLHFHAEARQDWLAALPFRLTRGAYQYRPGMQAWLAAASPGQIADFYRVTQMLHPETADLLRGAGRLVEAQLDLRRRIAGLSESGLQGGGT